MTTDHNEASRDATTPRLAAFKKAYDAFNAHFFGYYCRRFRDLHVAEDLAQDFWLSVFRRIPTDKLGEIRLLQQRAKEVAVDYIRRSSTRAFVEFRDEVPEAPGAVATEDAASEAAQQGFWAMVPDVNLTPQQKTVFWMNKRLGYTMENISQRLSVPVSTIGGWIARAMAECKRSLNKES